MHAFPYDTQKCSLDFGNVMEPTELVNITTSMSEVDLQSFYDSNEFEVNSPEVDVFYFEVHF